MNALRTSLLLLALAWVGPVLGQPMPRVWVAPQADLQPITLEEVAIEVTMHGFLARTRIEMSFANPNARVLEGEFVFPLGPGQTVSGYALEVNGKMREGVVVPKQTARVAFEDTIRAGIDPGLAELTRGNVFRTRLYPIPARGSKRIALEFEQLMLDDDSHWSYRLPLQFREPVKRFRVRAEAPVADAAPQIASDSPDDELRFSQASTVWRAELERENVTPQRELAFRVPKQPGAVSTLEAQDRLEPAERAIVARIDTGRPGTPAALPAPSHVALFFDASGSAADRDLERERAALAAWMKSFRDTRVDLIALRNEAEPARRFRIRKGNASALLEALAALPLDGASNYGAIDFASVPGADLAVIIGDGLDTWGTGQVNLDAAPARVFVLHAAQRADHARLARIARHGSAPVLDLVHMEQQAVVNALRHDGWRLLSIKADPACTAIQPAAPQPVGTSITLSARCKGPASLVLQFGDASGRARIERTVELGQREPVAGALSDSVWRLWAQARITALEEAAQPDHDAALALATRHGVVTAQTSLLVLDRIEDYVRYRVEPKEAELREAYQRLIVNRPKPGAEPDPARRLEELAKRWQSFREWHERRHPWLETLLVPAIKAEIALWEDRKAPDKMKDSELDSLRSSLDELLGQGEALAARWPQEGAGTDSRKAWEREAIGVMLDLDGLRNRRVALLPDSLLQSAGQRGSHQRRTLDAAASEAAPAPMSVPAPPPSVAPTEHSAPAHRIQADAATAPEPSAAARPAAPRLDSTVTLTAWNPDTPYLDALRSARDGYATYLELRAEHGSSPAFYIDVADHLRDEAKKPELALRVLSNLAEIGDEDAALLRVLAYRLAHWQQAGLAVRPLEDVLEQRPEEPQSHRDLALVLSRLDEPDNPRAAQLLWAVATGDWHPRFAHIDQIALHELVALLATDPDLDTDALGIPAELLHGLEIGLRVVLGWDADNSDIDLWVIDPIGQVVYYGNRRSVSGGDLSHDFTQGYGPEVFTIAHPLPGTYHVQAHYYGDRRQTLTGPVTVQLEFQRGFGSANPTSVLTTRRLETGKQRIDVGRFRVAP